MYQSYLVSHMFLFLIICSCGIRDRVHLLGDDVLVSFNEFAAAPIFEIEYVHGRPVITKGNRGTEDNRYGFEGGRALKYNNEYHVFTTEMAGNPLWARTRLAHWKSIDLNHWERVSVLFESSGDFTGDDPNAAFWSPMPTFDSHDGRWILTFVAYNSKPNTPESWYRNYNGKIWLAKSDQPGFDGLGGPYSKVEILLEADKDSDVWEGLMGIDSFFPYPAGNSWFAFYGSSPESVGLAEAPDLAGPWTRKTEVNPIRRYIENPIVTRLSDGRFIALFDGCGQNRKIGYMISDDGVSWSKEVFFDLDAHIKPWWKLTRTPLGLIQESEDLFTVFFTAYNKDFYEIPDVWKSNDDNLFDGYFASLGYFRIRLIK
jgi:hypothetical protein